MKKLFFMGLFFLPICTMHSISLQDQQKRQGLADAIASLEKHFARLAFMARVVEQDLYKAKEIQARYQEQLMRALLAVDPAVAERVKLVFDRSLDELTTLEKQGVIDVRKILEITNLPFITTVDILAGLDVTRNNPDLDFALAQVAIVARTGLY